MPARQPSHVPEMKVAFFEFVTHYGGASRSVVEFATRLKQHVGVAIVDPYGCCDAFAAAARQAGLDYHVLCPEAGPAVRQIGGQGRPLQRAWRLLRSLPNLVTVHRRAERLLKELEVDVVSSNNFKGAFIVGTIRALRHVPTVVHLRGWYTPDMMPWYGKWLCRRRCAAVFAVSHATRTAVICAGVDPTKVHVLHNPIDVDETVQMARRPLDAPLPQSDRPVRIIVPASLIRTKGQHTAVKAMRRILDAGHDAVLYLPGDPIGHQSYVTQTQALAERLGVADRVEWLGFRFDMPQLMNASTVVVLPSHTEGHPRAVLEAMALAKPVAATPVGGIVETLVPNLTGLFFDVEDDQGLAQCVNEFVASPERAREMGKMAQECMRKSFHPSQQIAKALKVFRQVTGLRANE